MGFSSPRSRPPGAFVEVADAPLLCRQLGPVSWAKAFGALLEALGVKTGSGKGDPSGKAVTVTALAEGTGVAPATARNRLKLAKDLEPYPDTA